MIEEELARELNKHYPTRGMKVAMGETCECGYWTGEEDRFTPHPWGLDRLDLHRARIALTFIAEVMGLPE